LTRCPAICFLDCTVPPPPLYPETTPLSLLLGDKEARPLRVKFHQKATAAFVKCRTFAALFALKSGLGPDLLPALLQRTAILFIYAKTS